MAADWQNWSGLVSARPTVTERPTSEEQVATVVGQAAQRRDRQGGSIRPVGSGHSFTELCVTRGTHIDLSAMSGLVGVDKETNRVRVQAGMTLGALGRLLLDNGLALENLGDINTQQVGGALATGTHGTGARFGNISSQVRAMRLVTADGSTRELTDGDELRAARISLGALGVVTEVELQAVHAFRLHRVQTPRTLDSLLPELHDRVDSTDHVELYLFPHTRRALLLESTRTDAPAQPTNPLRLWFERDFLENTALGSMMRIAATQPRVAPMVSQGIAALATAGERIDESSKVFASVRRVKFVEMEYAIPAEHAITVVEQLLDMIVARRVPVAFPIEVRFSAPDDALLSTAQGRDTAYVAVHQYVGLPYQAYFDEAEEIFLRHGGRPHWGKRHSLTAKELSKRFPGWDHFQGVRRKLDPTSMFSGAYLQKLLGSVR